MGDGGLKDGHRNGGGGGGGGAERRLRQQERGALGVDRREAQIEGFCGEED